MAAWDPKCFGNQQGVIGAIVDGKKLADAAGVPTISCIESLFQNLIQSLMAIAGVGFFLMLLVGGYSFLFSGGDPKKLQQAKSTITLAIVGLIIMMVALLVIRVIESFTGINLHNFKIITSPPTSL